MKEKVVNIFSTTLISVENSEIREDIEFLIDKDHAERYKPSN